MKSYPLILLAAGNSSRMGYPKGLATLKNKTLLEFQIESFLNAGGKKIILILGHALAEYQNHFSWIEKNINCWQPYKNSFLKVLINPTPEQGQFSSLLIACKEVVHDSNLTGAFILPIDVPVMLPGIWNWLSSEIKDHKVCMPTYQSKGGHPVLLSRDFIKKLLNIPFNDPNARLDLQIHHLNAAELMTLEVDDDSILKNINTQDDLYKM